MGIQVKDFMTTSVITAEGKNSIGKIRTLMRSKEIHAIPIVGPSNPDDGVDNIRGIVTTTDLYRPYEDSTPVEEILPTERVHVIPPHTSAQSAAQNLLRHRVHHLVVMDDGKIVGMISSQDFVKLVSEYSLDKPVDKVY